VALWDRTETPSSPVRATHHHDPRRQPEGLRPRSGRVRPPQPARPRARLPVRQRPVPRERRHPAGRRDPVSRRQRLPCLRRPRAEQRCWPASTCRRSRVCRRPSSAPARRIGRHLSRRAERSVQVPFPTARQQKPNRPVSNSKRAASRLSLQSPFKPGLTEPLNGIPSVPAADKHKSFQVATILTRW
jgi:hypothetical protein